MIEPRDSFFFFDPSSLLAQNENEKKNETNIARAIKSMILLHIRFNRLFLLCIRQRIHFGA